MTTVTMMERPILFSGRMVRAILDGKKTQTRRVMKPQPPKEAAVVDPYNGNIEHFTAWSADHKMFLGPGNVKGTAHWRCPYGKPGDRLWVRETWAYPTDAPDAAVTTEILYHAGCLLTDVRWRPSIHMPRRASRLSLEIVAIRAEMVKDVSHDDAVAEGCYRIDPCAAYPNGNAWGRAGYAALWDEINSARGFGWETNPWVWVVSFKRISAVRAE
jgi:hypothetical protein